MKFLFLSDIHLGSPLFQEHDKLEEVLNSNFEHLYLLGDILDVQERDLNKIIKRNKNIINRIKFLGSKVTIIKGNHDPELSEIQSLFPKAKVLEESQFEKFKLIHGHEFGLPVLKYSFLVKLLFKLHWFFERIGINLQAIFRTLYISISSIINGEDYEDIILDVEKSIIDKYSGKYSGVICGHTHMPKQIEHGGFLYINCGDWIHNNTYLQLDDSGFRIINIEKEGL